MTETFYDVLGVPTDATTDEIEAAYRERLKETHPDVSDADDAREVTQALVEARDVLVDEAARERYDRLGHEAYVRHESSVAESDVAAAARRAGYAESEGGQTESSDASSTASDAGDPRQRARERAERERRASERVRADREERTGTKRGDDGRTARADSDPTGGWSADTDAPGGYAGAGETSAWTATSSYAVRENVQPGPRYERLVPTGRELTLLGLTFALYPVLLFSALVPAFPLFVNLVLGVCLVLVVGYLQSVPNVAILVFGIWSLLTPLVLLWVNVSFFSLLGVVALCGTWLPFGFSILTYSVLRL
ncbi:J domain-containing protein [Haloarcula sp. JP-L23]|uniref:J domain-containing protein n=1 Tax=Haloarcula sp. JP-L23 TaxID=2716717 RepID=UPI00140F01E8|nr:DnaJ domain-containing protein [Haloarcula sp. JP-L23]